MSSSVLQDPACVLDTYTHESHMCTHPFVKNDKLIIKISGICDLGGILGGVAIAASYTSS